MNQKLKLLLAVSLIALVAVDVGSTMFAHANEDDSHTPEQISQELQTPPDEHAGEEGEEGHAEGEAEAEAKPLTPEQMQEAGIVVEPVALTSLPKLFRAPGEVRLNNYTSSIISPRISGTVIQRHVTLGAVVKKNDPLLRMFSVTMAEAQSFKRGLWRKAYLAQGPSATGNGN